MKVNEAPALTEGMHILELIAASKMPVPFQLIADSSGMSRASVTRLLRVLSESGYLDSNIREGYTFGIKFLYLLKAAANKLEPLKIISEKLQDLSNSINASIQFAVFDRVKPAVTVISKAECENSPVLTGAGSDITGYSHRHALGKVIMAFAEAKERERILDRNTPYKKTAYTVMPGPQLDEILNRIKVEKTAFENQECMPGIQRVAVPLFNSQGKITGGLCASWFNPEFVREFSVRKAEPLRAAARFIENIFQDRIK
ncbi:MAG: IclR family transcriptional regulator C-terminal domain-containing protein [Victivallaceae bacterium]|nr:IclR family transcriptional regulator C-terminal domain-containing protein [Victivallaceae bacterium]